MNAFQQITTTLTGRSPWPFAKPSSADQKPTNKTEAMRAYLREHGAATSATLAEEADLHTCSLVGALLKSDLALGRVFRRGDRYHWNHQFDQVQQKRLKQAAALLRAHGYQVTKGGAA